MSLSITLLNSSATVEKTNHVGDPLFSVQRPGGKDSTNIRTIASEFQDEDGNENRRKKALNSSERFEGTIEIEACKVGTYILSYGADYAMEDALVGGGS